MQCVTYLVYYAMLPTISRGEQLPSRLLSEGVTVVMFTFERSSLVPAGPDIESLYRRSMTSAFEGGSECLWGGKLSVAVVVIGACLKSV